MLTLFDSANPSSRRAFLQTGSLALGGLSLPGFLSAQGISPKLLKDKSVIFLFMHGGPSQFETFDPKMDAPSGIRSIAGEVKTSLPGVTFSGCLPKLARQAHRMAVVRSYTTGSGAHDIKPIMTKQTLNANMGSLYARIAGSARADSGMPTNVALFPKAVDEGAQPETNKFGKFAATGTLGQNYAPFVPGGGGQLQSDMKIHIARSRLEDRRALLGGLDDLRRRVDGSASFTEMSDVQQQAFDTILGGAFDAFDLSKEDPRVVERYDTSKLMDVRQIRKVWNNHNNYRDHVNSLGKLMLMARRLCERGAGFVTVTTNFVWDMHADKNNATMVEGMRYVGNPFDHAVSAFLEDVEARGLSDKILLVCCGEMGRSPKINPKGGRDHWGKLAPLMLAGGGLNMGQVIGSSTRDGGEPDTQAITTPNLISTVLGTLVDVGQLRVTDGMPQELVKLAADVEPIPGLA